MYGFKLKKDDNTEIIFSSRENKAAEGIRNEIKNSASAEVVL